MRFLKTKLIGVVPEDDGITKGNNLGEESGYDLNRAITLLAENIHNGTKKIYDCAKKYKGFWGIIRRNLKRRV